MLLLIDPRPTVLHWCTVDNDTFHPYHCNWSDMHQSIIDSIEDIEQIEAVAYTLHHGGRTIRDTTSRLTVETLEELQGTAQSFFDLIEPTIAVAEHWLKRLPETSHLLLSDTAFFSNLPTEAATYALPQTVCQQGIRRYGGYGLCHEWIWQQAQQLLPLPAERIISVYLGDHTNLAAIRNGVPLDTSLGFSPVEGILSATACGDIDPTIIFHLHSAGASLADINRSLMSEAGFTGLRQKKCSYLDLMRGKRDPNLASIRTVLHYQILKYIGAFISLLGGADAIAFVSQHLNESTSFIHDICCQLEFLGIRFPKNFPQQNEPYVTGENTLTYIMALEYSPWRVLAGNVYRFLQGGVSNG